MSHAAALPKFSLLASLSPILSGVPILPRRHVRTDYTPVNDCSVWEFQTSFALSGTVGDFKKSPNNLWWSLMYSYAHHLKNQSLANPHNYGNDRVAHALPPMCLPPPTSLYYDWNGWFSILVAPPPPSNSHSSAHSVQLWQPLKD